MSAAAAVLERLRRGPLEPLGLLPRSSNYTFLCEVGGGDQQLLGVYKPRRGESPLMDFPDGSLYRREVASWVLSEGLSLGLVPPTVERDGPHGPGSLQLFIDHDPQLHYLSVRDQRQEDFWPLAVFDLVANNADRKSGHCLFDADGHLYAVDNGLTFAVEPKLRTVIWDFAGQDIPEEVREVMRRGVDDLAAERPWTLELSRLLTRREREALVSRLERAAAGQTMPAPVDWWSYPWPPV
ncbi:MAG: SCO1664 family protein [Candidatus Dormibacteria bacterium]